MQRFSFCITCLIFCTTCFLYSESTLSESESVKRIGEHLLIHDPLSALVEARKGLVLYPESLPLNFMLVRSLCDRGEEMEAIERVEAHFKEGYQDRKLLETLAWGVLYKADRAPQLAIRMNSLLGACFTRDARALPLLMDGLRASNALVRALAVRLSALLGDTPLQDELKRLLKEERVWYVRLEVLQALGQLHQTTVRPELKEIAGNPKTLAEEKAAALSALVQMSDQIDLQELRALVTSNRSGLRQLACEVVTYLDAHEQEILPLLRDTSPDVRLFALNVLGLLGKERFQNGALPIPLLEDHSAEVALTAGWVAFLWGDERGEEKLKEGLNHDNPHLRRLASAALATTGQRGVQLSLETLKYSQDPYVKANLALGLIGQRQHIPLACAALDALIESKEKLMFNAATNPVFHSLAPSMLRHRPEVPSYPKVVDQQVRLHLLSILSMMRYDKAQEAVKNFLKEQTWGIAGSAAATLLGEGDEEALLLVRELLNDPDEKIRVQAALMLAMFGKDEASVDVLQHAYATVDREMKIPILEALGHMGDSRSVPFLMQQLKEPYQVLRVVAASALIQCLYH